MFDDTACNDNRQMNCDLFSKNFVTHFFGDDKSHFTYLPDTYPVMIIHCCPVNYSHKTFDNNALENKSAPFIKLQKKKKNFVNIALERAFRVFCVEVFSYFYCL